MTCITIPLGDRKVAWVRTDSYTVLAIDINLITTDERFHIDHQLGGHDGIDINEELASYRTHCPINDENMSMNIKSNQTNIVTTKSATVVDYIQKKTSSNNNKSDTSFINKHNNINCISIWRLVIDGVQPTDGGEYMCQINTPQPETRRFILEIIGIQKTTSIYLKYSFKSHSFHFSTTSNYIAFNDTVDVDINKDEFDYEQYKRRR